MGARVSAEILVTQASSYPKSAIVYRWHSFGAPIVVRPRKVGVIYEERRRPTKHAGVWERYLVELKGSDRESAFIALTIAGYADDTRNPAWLTACLVTPYSEVRS